MGATKHSYIIRLEAENGKLVTSTLTEVGASGEKSMKKVAQGSVEANSKLDILTRTMITRLIPAISAYKAATSIFNNVQQWEKLDNRMKFLTDSTEDYARAQEFLKTKARALNIDIFALADGYSRLLALQKGGVIDPQQTEELLIGLANAKAALGATDTQIGQAIYGMSQAMSSATVQAQEFNQVMEPLPGLMQSLDKVTGNVAGGYRELIKEQKITGQQFGVDLIKAFKEYEGAAQGLDGTVTAALSDLSNAWKELAKEIKDNDFITGNLADVISHFARLAEGAAELTRRLNDLHGATSQDFTIVPPAMDGAGLLPTQAGIAGFEARLQQQMGNLSTQDFGWDPKFDPDTGGIKGGRVPVPKEKPEEIILKGDKAREKVIATAQKEADAVRKVVEALRNRNVEMDYSDARQEISNQLRAAGVTIFSEEGQEIARLVNQYHEMRDAQKANEEQAKMMADAIRGSADAFTDLRGYALSVLAEIGAALVELGSGTGKGSGLGGLIANGIFSALGGAGGSSTKYGSNGLLMPPPTKPSTGGFSLFGMKLFAGGGVSDQPAVFGEGAYKEAAVPLPDGRSIPVDLKGGGQQSASPVFYINAQGSSDEGYRHLASTIQQLHGELKRVEGSIPTKAIAAVTTKFGRSSTFLQRRG